MVTGCYPRTAIQWFYLGPYPSNVSAGAQNTSHTYSSPLLLSGGMQCTCAYTFDRAVTPSLARVLYVNVPGDRISSKRLLWPCPCSASLLHVHNRCVLEECLGGDNEGVTVISRVALGCVLPVLEFGHKPVPLTAAVGGRQSTTIPLFQPPLENRPAILNSIGRKPLPVLDLTC